VRSGDVVGGRFRVESLAGSGGMGSVWRALDQQTGRRVALKLLHGRDPRDTARFIREAQVIAGLAHPGIVGHVADGQISDSERYLVMEWLDGESLADRLDRAPLTLAETLAMGRRASEALGAMHGQGVVHRDLKPSNLFLEGNDPERVKVIDFGIARSTAGPEVTRAGVLLGTPGYIAPEQALGDPNVDARADVFALGCVLFKCLTGEGAYGMEDDLTILLRIVKGTARRARDVVRHLPAEIDEVLAWMLARNPADRPRDASVVAAALARLEAIYGAGRPGDDPLDELITTRSQAVDYLHDEPSLGTTSPFPLTVPRSRPGTGEGSDDDLPLLSAEDLEEIRTDTGHGDASRAFAANVARAIAAAEAAQQAPPGPSPVALPAPVAQIALVTPPGRVARPTPPTPLPVVPPAPVPAARAPLASIPDEGHDLNAVQCLARVEAFLEKNDFRTALVHVRRGIDAGAHGQLYGALRTRQAEAYRWRGERFDAERAATDAMTALVPGTDLWWLAAREAVLGAGARGGRVEGRRARRGDHAPLARRDHRRLERRRALVHGHVPDAHGPQRALRPLPPAGRAPAREHRAGAPRDRRAPAPDPRAARRPRG
jgi:serine/threonine protein kinase